MPTTLTIYGTTEELNIALVAFNRLISDQSFDQVSDLKSLISVFNNSIVGVSKMLHFAALNRFAIWDGRVAAACNYALHGNRRRNAAAYLKYIHNLRETVEHQDFTAIYEQVKAAFASCNIGSTHNNFTRLRAGELILFCSKL